MLGVLTLPLAAGFLYALAALPIKQALASRLRASTMALMANLALAIGFVPVAFASGAPLYADPLWPALLYGATVAAGNFFVFVALVHGDVSVATPILGSKVVMVALLASLVLDQALGAETWVGVGLCALALFLLQWGGPGASQGSLGLTVLASLLACSGYAVADIVVQRFAPAQSFSSLLLPAFLFGALLSLVALPVAIRDARRLPGALKPALGGAALNVGQALLLSYSIALYEDATTTNIVYGLRGVFSLLLVVVVGRLFDNRERRLGARVLGARLAGAVLMVGAVAVAMT